MFKIRGLVRRHLKKNLSLSKWILRSSGYCHQLDKDMSSFYGTSENYPMSDNQHHEWVEKEKLRIKNIEEQLNERV